MNFNKIKEQLKPFKFPIILILVLLVGFIILKGVLPAINNAVANTTPVTSIYATNDTEYASTDELKASDFIIKAVHENGKETRVSADDVEMTDVKLNPVGATTTTTIYLKDNPDIKCDVEVSIKREKVVGFQVGYPNIEDVTAVLYSNGELCFEGKGDVLVCDEGAYPWLDYDGMDENPITAVSFEDGVTPTDMNYWFEGIGTLTYVTDIPASVRTMVRTFQSCTSLVGMPDWTKCENLLNINQAFEDCEALTETVSIPASVRTAYRAFAECDSLATTPDSSNATSLTIGEEMYDSCKSLVNVEIAPNMEDMSSMFANCINLRNMPTIPESVTKMERSFENDVSLSELTTIPAKVDDLSYAFSGCEMIHGEITINCDALSSDGVFGDACIATNVNLVGDSIMLDVYANTSSSGNVYVNGHSPNEEMKSYDDVVRSGNVPVVDVTDEGEIITDGSTNGTDVSEPQEPVSPDDDGYADYAP